MINPEPISFAGDGGLTLRGDRWTPSGWESLPDVLMFPGGGQTRHSWKTAGVELAKRGFRVTSMDSRGHGESDFSPTADYGIVTMARDVLAVVAAIGRPVVYVGASMGGLTGILATPQTPAITALVLVDVVPAYEKAGSARIRNFMQGGMSGFASLDEAADAIAAYLPHRPKARSHEGLKRNLRLAEDGRWYWHWDPAFMQMKPSESPDARLHDLEDAASRITVPLLLIRGKMSDIVSAEGVQRFLSIAPQTQVVELANAAHTAAGDDNEAFAATVIDFVTGVSQSG